MKEAAGSGWTVSAWRGIAGPKGMPADVQQRLATAVKKIWDSKEFKDFATSKGYGMEWAPPAGIRDVHGEGRRRHGRRHEGRRPGEVTPAAESRAPAARRAR
jgi:hypothetical protein